MASNFVYEPYEQSFTNVNTVVVNHQWNRAIDFKLFISNEVAEADYEYIDDNSFRLRFYEKGVLVQKSGKVLVS